MVVFALAFSLPGRDGLGGKPMYDVAIIGCGVIGASIAYTLSQYDLRILILERENDVAMGTTKANSAIVHAGFDAESGSLMARLNVEGNEMMEGLSRELDFPFPSDFSRLPFYAHAFYFYS